MFKIVWKGERRLSDEVLLRCKDFRECGHYRGPSRGPSRGRLLVIRVTPSALAHEWIWAPVLASYNTLRILQRQIGNAKAVPDIPGDLGTHTETFR